MNVSINSIYSSKMFPLTGHMYSAGLNVYNLSDSISRINEFVSGQGTSVKVNYNLGKNLDVYA
ncbi:hypothetical protein [Brachyspira pilosicoli]|uniref:hypothetical protein n=1 Tax=Brachyspira pilosicoli TaxID=52584 RepID=UPI001CA5F1C7|nr:hypothetical protein [Brachyspira pilosicoli]MBW5398020.1 hypothetical protein [Brachyspira pilosicoli]